MTHILVVDNYDSFVHTIDGYLRHLGATTLVVRNDAVTHDVADFDGVLVSPGPGTPKEAGASGEVVEACAAAGVPVLGVCLGHQVLAELYGGVVDHAPELMHGRTSDVEHDGRGVFDGLPDPFTASRYHSLAVVDRTVPDELEVTARTPGGVIMGLSHRELPLHGVQFHPESVMTQGGHRLLANWLALTGDEDAVNASQGMAPLVRPQA